MRICVQCGKRHNRKTKLCNACYTNQPHQIKFKRKRWRKAWGKEKEQRRLRRMRLVCVKCGKVFEGSRSDQKYCSEICRQNRRRESSYKKKKKGIAMCVICGRQFEQKRIDSKCCSIKCIRKWEYVKRDKEKKRFYERTRDHKKRAGGGEFTIEQWKKMKKKYKYTCPACGREEPEINLTIDHVIPISKGGKHSSKNIQPLCLKCNVKKSNNLIAKYEYSTK